MAEYENNFTKMINKAKYYIKKHEKSFRIQMIITAIITIIAVGQFGQTMAYMRGKTKAITMNPLKLIFYSIRLLPVFLLLFLIINVIIFIFISNMEDKNYDKDRNFQISDSGTMGTGGFMTEDDKHKSLYMKTIEETTGIILGRDTETDLILSPKETLYLNGHKCVCGGSGARKTTTQALNDLFQIIRSGSSFIVTDPKAEIYGMLAVMCEKEGYDVKSYNLVNLINSDAIDFVKCCRSDDGDQDTEVKNVMTLVQVIMSNTSNEGEAGFWKDLQTGLLTAGILYVMYDTSGNTQPTLAGAYSLILEKNGTELDRLFNNLDNSHPAKAQYLVYAKTEDKIRSSVIVGLTMRLQILQTNAAKRIISEDEIDLTAPGKRKCAYFIIMSDQERTFDFLSSLFFSMFFIKETAYADSQPDRKTKVPVYLIMDEFPSIGTLPDFSRKLATLRSRQILITIIFQNYGQIMDKYEKHEWQTIVSNCDINVYLGGNDGEETAKFYVNRMGEMTAVSKGKRKEEHILSPTNNRFYPTATVTESETSRSVMTVDELLRMNTDNAIVMMKSCRPLLVRKFVYTEHPFSERIEDRNATNHIPKWRRQCDGYPEEFLDEELAPLIKYLADKKSLITYLNERKIHPTYDIMTFLQDCEPEVYELYYEIYKNRIESNAQQKSNETEEKGTGELDKNSYFWKVMQQNNIYTTYQEQEQNDVDDEDKTGTEESSGDSVEQKTGDTGTSERGNDSPAATSTSHASYDAVSSNTPNTSNTGNEASSASNNTGNATANASASGSHQNGADQSTAERRPRTRTGSKLGRLRAVSADDVQENNDDVTEETTKTDSQNETSSSAAKSANTASVITDASTATDTEPNSAEPEQHTNENPTDADTTQPENLTCREETGKENKKKDNGTSAIAENAKNNSTNFTNPSDPDKNADTSAATPIGAGGTENHADPSLSTAATEKKTVGNKKMNWKEAKLERQRKKAQANLNQEKHSHESQSTDPKPSDSSDGHIEQQTTEQGTQDVVSSPHSEKTDTSRTTSVSDNVTAANKESNADHHAGLKEGESDAMDTLPVKDPATNDTGDGQASSPADNPNAGQNMDTNLAESEDSDMPDAPEFDIPDIVMPDATGSMTDEEVMDIEDDTYDHFTLEANTEEYPDTFADTQETDTLDKEVDMEDEYNKMDESGDVYYEKVVTEPVAAEQESEPEETDTVNTDSASESSHVSDNQQSDADSRTGNGSTGEGDSNGSSNDDSGIQTGFNGFGNFNSTESAMSNLNANIGMKRPKRTLKKADKKDV